MKKHLALLSILLAILLSGCATAYYPIQPNNVNYDNTEIKEKISYAYTYDVLYKYGNIKYARKEQKYDIDIVSFKIINNTDKEIDFNKNVKFYMDKKEIYPVNSTFVTSAIKQGVIAYALYGLLFIVIEKDYNSIKIPIGLPIGILNIIKANSANKDFQNEFITYNLADKKIKAYETIYGLVAFKGIEFGQIDIEIIEN